MSIGRVLDIYPFDGRGEEATNLYGQRALGEETLLLVGKYSFVVFPNDLETFLGGESVGVEELVVAIAMPLELGLGNTCIVLCNKGKGREQ